MNAPQSKPEQLPVLRADLRLMEGAPARSGEPRWLIHDPIQQRYIQIEPTARRLLTLWPFHQTAAAMAKAARDQFRLEIDEAEITEFGKFLVQNFLTVNGKGQEWHALYHRASHRHSLFARVLHNYLFVRVPLAHPTAFLRATYPYIAFLFTRAAVILFGVFALVGLYLVSRQWEAFLSTFQYFFTIEGFLAFGAALVFVKLIHELGHAYMAVRFGCVVPTMGIAFVVMTPMPYTDVTDAWKLTDRRQRLLIDAAGVMAELGVAVIATILWVFLPDGPLRSVMLMLATVSWITSVLMNISPLMRFDGYYLLSEMWGIENLQSRSFAIGRWRLRELLFGLGEPPPENFAPRTRMWLTIYAWTVWIYRLVMFLGIALFVYYYFFKALGIFLFAVEIVYFIAWPIGWELKNWYGMRKKIISRPRSWITLGVAVAAAVAAAIPWSVAVYVPAVLEVADTTPLFAPAKAVVERVGVVQGERVVKGQILALLRSPLAEQQLVMAETKLRLINMRLARRVSDSDDRESSLALENERASLETKVAGLRDEIARLTIVAPDDGVVLELNRALHEGRWIGIREMVALVGDPMRASARGYLTESDLWRVKADSEGVFIPEFPTRSAVPLRVAAISLAGVQSIDLKELSSSFGGHVAAKPDTAGGQKRELPVSGEYLIQFRPREAVTAPEKIIRGTVQLAGEAESLASRAWRQVLKVLIRESGV